MHGLVKVSDMLRLPRWVGQNVRQDVLSVGQHTDLKRLSLLDLKVLIILHGQVKKYLGLLANLRKTEGNVKIHLDRRCYSWVIPDAKDVEVEGK